MVTLRLLFPIAAYFFFVRPSRLYSGWQLTSRHYGLLVLKLFGKSQCRIILAEVCVSFSRCGVKLTIRRFPRSVGFELGNDYRCWICYGDCSGFGRYCRITPFPNLVDYLYVSRVPDDDVS